MNQLKTRARIAVGSFFFMHGLCFSTWASRIPAIQERLKMSEAQLGSILFAVPIGSILSMPLATWLVSRFGSRRVLFIAISFYGLTLEALGISQSQFQLLLALISYGLASNLVNVSLNTQAVRSEVIYQRPIMASFHGLWSLAGFSGALLGLVMIGKKIEPVWHFALTFSIMVLGATVAIRYLWEDEPAGTSPRTGRAFTLPDKSLLSLGFICFCVMVCEGTMFDWSGIYFSKVLNVKGSWVGAGYVAFMTTMAGTRFIADGLKERFGLNTILRMSSLTIFIGLMTSVLFPQLITSLIGFLLVGSGVSAVVPLVLSEAGRSKKMSSSAAIASVSTIGFLGFVAGPPLIGWIAEATSLRISFAVVAFLGLCIGAFTKISNLSPAQALSNLKKSGFPVHNPVGAEHEVIEM